MQWTYYTGDDQEHQHHRHHRHYHRHHQETLGELAKTEPREWAAEPKSGSGNLL